MYTFESRVRYSETDPDGFLTIASLINYLQDCSTFQCEDLGIGIEYMTGLKTAWLLNYWQIDICRLPRLGEKIVTGTSPYEIKGFMGLRNFMMETLPGERLVNVNSVWSYMDMEKGIPVRPPKEDVEKFVLYPKFEMEYTPRKIRIPKEGGVQKKKILVTAEHLDSNHHVNNEQYVHMALEGVQDMRNIRRLRVEYRMQAHLDDVIVPVCYQESAKDLLVALSNENGSVYAAVEVLL